MDKEEYKRRYRLDFWVILLIIFVLVLLYLSSQIWILHVISRLTDNIDMETNLIIVTMFSFMIFCYSLVGLNRCALGARRLNDLGEPRWHCIFYFIPGLSELDSRLLFDKKNS